MPVNEQAHLILRSEDVIHSFWVPEFRLKQDLVPGQEKELRITPTELGQYELLCAELCGTSHAYMKAPVNVLSAEDFEIWRQKRLGIYVEPDTGGEGGVAQDPAALGQQVASSAGCVACHSIDGSPLVGPTWKGLFGRTETMADGSTVTADEAYIEESILNPGAKLVQGYADVMPKNYADVLTPDEIKGIIEYIKTLN
jgi:cytochrome c oxidase subunit 2